VTAHDLRNLGVSVARGEQQPDRLALLEGQPGVTTARATSPGRSRNHPATISQPPPAGPDRHARLDRGSIGMGPGPHSSPEHLPSSTQNLHTMRHNNTSNIEVLH
jgi:hypothetical protein